MTAGETSRAMAALMRAMTPAGSSRGPERGGQLVDRVGTVDGEDGVDGASHCVLGGNVALDALWHDRERRQMLAGVGDEVARAHPLALRGGVYRDEHAAAAPGKAGDDSERTPEERGVARLLDRGEEAVAVEVEDKGWSAPRHRPKVAARETALGQAQIGPASRAVSSSRQRHHGRSPNGRRGYSCPPGTKGV